MENNKFQTITIPIVHKKYILISLGFLSFTIPFFFSSSQIITGSIVNAALFASALFLPKKYFLPIIVLPSLAVLSRGLIFGPFTPFLIYFLPIIWLGNFLLIYTFLKLPARTGKIKKILIASLVKWFILYSIANIYFNFHLIPKMFLQTMGIYQFITACIGGLLAFFLHKKYYGKL